MADFSPRTVNAPGAAGASYTNPFASVGSLLEGVGNITSAFRQGQADPTNSLYQRLDAETILAEDTAQAAATADPVGPFVDQTQEERAKEIYGFKTVNQAIEQRGAKAYLGLQRQRRIREFLRDNPAADASEIYTVAGKIEGFDDAYAKSIDEDIKKAREQEEQAINIAVAPVVNLINTTQFGGKETIKTAADLESYARSSPEAMDQVLKAQEASKIIAGASAGGIFLEANRAEFVNAGGSAKLKDNILNQIRQAQYSYFNSGDKSPEKNEQFRSQMALLVAQYSGTVEKLGTGLSQAERQALIKEVEIVAGFAVESVTNEKARENLALSLANQQKARDAQINLNLGEDFAAYQVVARSVQGLAPDIQTKVLSQVAPLSNQSIATIPYSDAQSAKTNIVNIPKIYQADPVSGKFPVVDSETAKIFSNHFRKGVNSTLPANDFRELMKSAVATISNLEAGNKSLVPDFLKSMEPAVREASVEILNMARIEIRNGIDPQTDPAVRAYAQLMSKLRPDLTPEQAMQGILIRAQQE